jgi:hypothetical protein
MKVCPLFSFRCNVVWVLSESQTGYTHQVEIYKGKSNTARYPNGLGYGFFLQSDNLPQIWIWQLPNNLLSYGKRFQVIPNPLGKKCTGGSYHLNSSMSKKNININFCAFIWIFFFMLSMLNEPVFSYKETRRRASV